MDYETLMMNFAPYIFVIVGIVISYTLYKIFSDTDLRIFLLINSIIQFIVATYTENAICVIVAIFSLIPIILSVKPEGGNATNGE